MSREMKQVGEVAVETGRIAIVDPCYVNLMPSLEGLAHVQGTVLGDGTYPVFTFSEDGHEYLAVRLSLFPGVTKESLFAGQGTPTESVPVRSGQSN